MPMRVLAYVILGLSAVKGNKPAPSATSAAAPTRVDHRSVIKVGSKDGTAIAVQCAGAGPSLLIVHGGTGDRKRWVPYLDRFASRFFVCAMDRRGHGESEAGANYRLQREFEDVAAVANALPGPVAVLGHSLGGVCALEAALLTKKITQLVLYEPPLQDLDHTWVADSMQRLIRAGRREDALVLFFAKAVMLTPAEISAMQAQPLWPARVAIVDIQIRELRGLNGYRFDPKRFTRLNVPTLMLTGSITASAQLKQATESLLAALPHGSLYVFGGQGHNAMDNVPDEFAAAVANFLQRNTAATGETR